MMANVMPAPSPEMILHLLQSSLHADQKLRNQSEGQLLKASAMIGFLSACTQLIASEQVDLSLRQAASIYFKNLVKRNWDTELKDVEEPKDGSVQKTFVIAESDKQFVRANILNMLVHVPTVLQSQLASALQQILSEDHPLKWTSYICDLVPFLTAHQDMRSINAGLIGLRELVKVYRWKSNNDRAPLTKAIKTLFGYLLSIANGIVGAPVTDLNAGDILKNIVKIYHSTIEYEMPKILREDGALIPWCTLLIQIIDKQMPENQLPSDKEDRDKHVWFKLKKWAYRSLYRIFNRYGNPALETFREGSYKAFAKNFMEKYAPSLVNAIFAQTEAMIAINLNVPEKILYTIFSFYQDFLKHKTTWNIVKPHTQAIVANFIYPRLCFSDEEQELWEEDPLEYIQKKVDPFEDFNSSSSAASSLLVSMVKDRFKPTFAPIVQFINANLSANADPVTVEMARKKDGALAMLSAIAETILGEKSEFRSQVGAVIINFVLPDLKSQFPFLCSRACQVLTIITQCDDENLVDLGEGGWLKVFEQLLHFVANGTEIPIRVHAAMALEHVVTRPGVAEAVSNHVGLIMQELLKLTSQLDLESLTTVMERFVEMFPNELTPYSVQLCTQLCEQYLRMMSEAMAKSGEETLDWDESGEKVMAAMGILKTISTMILSVPTEGEAQLALLIKLEEVVLPSIAFTLQNEIVDLYDDIFELVDTITFQLKRITPNMWQLFEVVYKVVMDSGIDFIEEIFPSIDNYISYGSDVICSTPKLQQMLFEMIQRVLTSDSLSEEEQLLSFKMMEAMLLHCRGRIDSAIEPFLKMAFERLDSKKTTAFFVHCLEVVINCIYYNPIITLTVMEQNGWVQPFFSSWLGSQSKLTRVHDKKLSIVALLSLIQTANSDASFQLLPESLRAGWPMLMKSLLHFFTTLPKAIEARAELEKYHEGGSDDEDEETENDMTGTSGGDISASGTGDETDEEYEEVNEEDEDFDGDDDHDVPDDENEYLEYLARKAAKGENEEEDYDDEDWSNELSEELYFTSPLDDVDVYELFRNIIQISQQQAPTAYGLLTLQLTSQEQEAAQMVFSTKTEKSK